MRSEMVRSTANCARAQVGGSRIHSGISTGSRIHCGILTGSRIHCGISTGSKIHCEFQPEYSTRLRPAEVAPSRHFSFNRIRGCSRVVWVEWRRWYGSLWSPYPGRLTGSNCKTKQKISLSWFGSFFWGVYQYLPNLDSLQSCEN